ncbi:MAG: hypothetical protein JRF49_11485 [Deltaproteobacteria bacterium]|nr:hypothetical protein [Deltaproteobacteria bacterium]MBW2184468.1 hypothetical protein [Deltaproteobacteria bacterium]
MSYRGRRGRKSEFFSQVQDPGKDLFAYLFLVMLIFSFVILLTYEQKVRRQTIRKSPEEVSQGRSSLVTLKNKEIGKLIKRDGRIYLLFGEKSYRPDTDIASLEKEGIVKTIQRDGKEAKMLYIEEEPRSRIYLREYLETFSALSDQGIDIAFARKVK